MKKQIFLSIFFILTANRVLASFSLHTIESLNNQLSNNAILCMHQDRYGFMWFGTYDGLNLYNGKDVNVFRFESDNPYSLLGGTIYSILDAEDAFLWIATQLGVNKFSLKDRRVVESFPDYKKVELIAADSRGNVWILNKENYLSYYDIEFKTFDDIYMEGVSTSTVKEIFTGENSELNMIMENGTIKQVSVKTSGSKHLPVVIEKKLHETKLNIVLFEEGIIYFVDSFMNLYMFDVSKKQKILIRNMTELIDKYGSFSNIAFFRDDIYIAFTHNGLIRLNMKSRYQPELINMNNGIFCVLKDKNQDALWVGTDGHGVELLYNEKDKLGNILLENLPLATQKPIRAFFTDQENSLWFGTKGDGIFRIKDYEQFNHRPIPFANVQHFVTNNGLYENPVFCFAPSRYNPNDLWIGTNGGVSYYSYKENKIHAVADLDGDKPVTYIHSLCETSDSTLWLATVGGGVRQIILDKTQKPYKIKRKHSFFFQKDNNRCDEFYSMIYDGDSSLIIGSRGGYGVVCFNIHNQTYRFVSMNNAGNKAIGDVLCVYVSRDSALYIGASSGLTVVNFSGNEANTIKQFNRKNGIINDMIHGILEDNNGIIWLSTNKGLVKYNPQNDSFYNYQSPKIGVVEFSDDAYWRCPLTGRLFFGGVNGLVWIESKAVEEQMEYEPDLSFFELTSFDGEVHALYDYNEDKNKRLILPANKNSFMISFTVLDYIDGENYDFSYILENYNPDWVSLQKNNRISLTNIPPGDYSLKVKYKNDVVNDGDKVYSLLITILPPWYFSFWAFAVYFFLFLLALFTGVVFLRKRWRKKQQWVTEKIKEEQKEKLLESKLRFFTNVTHELFTPLTLINGSCEQIVRWEESDPLIKKHSKILKSSVDSLNELIQEIIDFRKIEESETPSLAIKHLPVSEILNNQLIQFGEVVEQNKIKLTTNIPDNLYWNTDRACFKKIIVNLISNAFKYTKEKGEVRVALSIENNALKIVVYNTGQGIAPDKIHSIFDRYSILENTDVNAYNQMTSRNGLGLFICHSMTKHLQGEINVKSEENRYVEFTVELPELLPAKEETNSTSVSFKSENLLPAQTLSSKKKQTGLSVLIVDDNKDIVELISDILSSSYAVMKAYTGEEALAMMQQQTPTLIITDVMMPGIDGFSMVNQMRRNKYTRHIPVIVVSAKVNDRDQASGYDIGADAYLTKPFSSEVLLSIVNRLIANKYELKDYFQSPESAYGFTGGVLLHQKDKEFIYKVIEVIRKNLEDESLRAEMVAEKMGINSRTLYRQMKRIVEVTPSDFIKEYKFSQAAKLLVSTDLTVQEIIYRIGISNKSYFYKEFTKKYKLPPKEFRNNAKKLKTK
jgi:signal transduction histidine kinase/DNA-binding response OmpR family regulator/ligand-binding sensor domain-containing protein